MQMSVIKEKKKQGESMRHKQTSFVSAFPHGRTCSCEILFLSQGFEWPRL